MATPGDVLAQLDAAHADFRFPDLGHGYYYAIDARLRAFGDGERWALLVEAVGYSPRAANVIDVLHYFGNCLTHGAPGFEDEDFLTRVENMDAIGTDEETFRGGPIVLRGREVTVPVAAGADLVDAFRALVPGHRELLLATEAEVRARIPADLPLLLQLEEWHQPALYEDPPSAAEAYRQLAEVVAASDAGRYRPTEPPNTHWSNWPDSGSL